MQQKKKKYLHLVQELLVYLEHFHNATLKDKNRKCRQKKTQTFFYWKECRK